jgi:hypothetical protein
MPAVTLIPQTILIQTGLTGAVSDVQDDPAAPDANWLVTTAAGNSILRVGFGAHDPLTGQQTFRARVRANNTAGNAISAALQLWANGAAVRTLTSVTAVAAGAGQVLTGTWDAAEAPSGAELRLEQTAGGSSGSTANRRYLEVGAARWDAQTAEPDPDPPPQPDYDYLQAADWLWDPIPASPALDAQNATRVASLADGVQQVSNVLRYAVAVRDKHQTTAATPRRSVVFEQEPAWGPHPLGGQTMAWVDGQAVPEGNDKQYVSVDPTVGWVQSIYKIVEPVPASPAAIDARWGGRVGIDSDGRGDGSVGAGVSRLAGVVRIHEIAAGHIPHALVFSTDVQEGPNDSGNFRYPATKTDGNKAAGPGTIPAGTRIQLDPSIDLDALPGLTAFERVVGKALQTYGAYCVDNGGARMAFQFELNPGGGIAPAYTAAGVTGDYFRLNLPWSSLRVLAAWDGSEPEPPPQTGVIATDTYSRTVSGGWGTADSGHPYTVTGVASDYSVGDGVGRIDISALNSERQARLLTVSAADVRVSARFRLPAMPLGGSFIAYLIARFESSSNYIMAGAHVAPSGAVTLRTIARSGAVTTTLSPDVTPGVTLAAGEWLNVELEAEGTGTTVIRLKAWKEGAAKPSAWQMERETTLVGVQAAGAGAVRGFMSSTMTNALPYRMEVDDLLVENLAAAPTPPPSSARAALTT